LHWLLWPATKRVWRGAYRVVANSEGLRQIALAADADQRVEVIHNGIATATPAPRTNSAGALRILAVSRLIQRKGLDTLIRAIALLRDEPVSVVVAGDGPQRESLSALARQLAVGDRITFKGFLPQVALAQEHLDCDVFVLASHSESCSMALLHAMGAGLPVIASRVGGTPELVRHERNGLLFSAGSEIELAAAIRLMLREPARGVAYGAANVALSRDVHSWGAVASRYEALFRAAIADSAGAARKALV
jgi:glycosyltransferase involved in cell wall biosynthesis